MACIDIEYAEFQRIKCTFTPDNVYMERIQRELLKCKMTKKSALVPSNNRPYRHYNNNNNNSNNYHRHGVSKPVATRRQPSVTTTTILGLLNKISVKNVDVIIERILEQTGDVKIIVAKVLDQAIKQNGFLSLFIRILSELYKKHVCIITTTIDEFVAEFVKVPIMTRVPEVVDVAEYDEFCARLKAIRNLTSSMMLVVAVIKVNLCTYAMGDLARYVCDNLFAVNTIPDLEVTLEVVEAFIKGGHAPNWFLGRMSEWASTIEGTDILTPRARFKLMDILE
jgi:hypothetical protein